MLERLHIIGDHEPNVVQQLDNCVSVEGGAMGVLCADGHQGYSQPIGGAMASSDTFDPFKD